MGHLPHAPPALLAARARARRSTSVRSLLAMARSQRRVPQVAARRRRLRHDDRRAGGGRASPTPTSRASPEFDAAGGLRHPARGGDGPGRAGRRPRRSRPRRAVHAVRLRAVAVGGSVSRDHRVRARRLRARRAGAAPGQDARTPPRCTRAPAATASSSIPASASCAPRKADGSFPRSSFDPPESSAATTPRPTPGRACG